MSGIGFSRWSAASGILFFVFLCAGFVLLVSGGGQIPDDPARRMEFITEARSKFGGSAFLIGLAGISFLWFAATLYARLRGAEREASVGSTIALLGGAVYGVFLLVSSYFGEQAVTAAVIDKNATVTMVMSMIDVDPVLFDAVWAFPVALMLVAIALSAWQTKALPRSLVWASAALAVLLIASAAATYVARVLVILLGLALFLVWVLVTSVVLLIGERRT